MIIWEKCSDRKIEKIKCSIFIKNKARPHAGHKPEKRRGFGGFVLLRNDGFQGSHDGRGAHSEVRR